eukprot:CAMPEP_0174728480 /NCGR_PEP_ID=MMETSP1094-20130205/51807_1 /TAXON_ID=156173 /ORGANISM="Chrysochromulina brevifilum, Strain UTEX LB 985" /LENGTH=70 /DNA_ID=CAMNT_0015930413 /DNA_START=18 /DNA_END=226 /DNA_ORIENTATION=+
MPAGEAGVCALLESCSRFAASLMTFSITLDTNARLWRIASSNVLSPQASSTLPSSSLLSVSRVRSSSPLV